MADSFEAESTARAHSGAARRPVPRKAAGPLTPAADAKLAFMLAESEKASNAELSRKDALTQKAEKYLTAVGILTGFYLAQLLPTDSPAVPKSLAYPALLLGALVLLAAALSSMLLALRVQKYLSYPSGDELLRKVGAPEVTPNAARIIILRTYCKARDVNAGINDQRAYLLALGGAFLTAAFILAATGHLLARF